MYLLVIRISLLEYIYDSAIFEECLRFNLQNKDIEKILIISNFSIGIKNDKIVYKVDKVNNLDIVNYAKKLYPNKNIILLHPYTKILEDLSKLQKNTKYVNDYLTIYPILEKNGINHDFSIEVLIKEYSEKVTVIKKEKKKERNKDSLLTLIVSVNYHDKLDKILENNTKILDNIFVITDITDIKTKEISKDNNINFLEFDILEDGLLNKSKAINLAIEYLKPLSYVLLLDSDIILTNKIDINKLNKNYLYSSKRVIFDTYDDFLINKYYSVNEPSGLGYFQLFHVSRFNKYLDSGSGRFSKKDWNDKVFSSKFNDIKILKDIVYHIGKINSDWIKVEKKEIQVFIGIASIPSRENSLKYTINSLIDQVDKIGVYLNGWGNNIPDYLINSKIVLIRSEDNGDYGDAGKFYWVDGFKGYYFTGDDDIIYPSDYIERTINKINFYNRKAVIGFHGSVILDKFTTYYDSGSRWVLSFRHKRVNDEVVHILGTGTIGFYTETIKVSFYDFNIANIADILFAKLGQEQKVPFIVQSHEQDEMIPIIVEESLSRSGIYNMNNKLNTTEIQNNIVRNTKWNINHIDNLNRKLRILMIGRFTTYKKGGIYKSNQNMKKIFEKLGHIVYVIDSMDSKFDINSNIDLCIVYPGDFSRPDFIEAEKKMLLVQSKKIPCCINMSYVNDYEKSEKIVSIFKKYNTNNKTKVFFLTFTEDVRMDPLLFDIKEYIISFPKTIYLDMSINYLPTYEERSGIIIGDVAKLQNNHIINGSAQEWIDAIKSKLPNIKIYAYKQYGTKTKLSGLELIPYNTDSFSEIISKIRISICINQKASFEMLPVETQLLGLPVIYRDMPQSLNQWVGNSGICVNTPKEMSEFIYWIYNNKDVWEKYSKLSILNSERNKVDNIFISFDASLRKILINL